MNRPSLTLIRLLLLLLCFFPVLSGCSGGDRTELVLTSDFEKNEVFRIESRHCYLEEAEIYMRSSGEQYQTVFGSEIWKRNLKGTTLGRELKKTTLARLAQIKAMNLLAEDRGLSLDEEEEEKASTAAVHFLAGMLESGETVSPNAVLIRDMYREYALADKVYHQITQDVNPEISDDEARNITVRQILIRTSSMEPDGSRVDFSPEEKAAALSRAEELLQRIQAGEDFDTLADEYNQGSESQFTFGRGTMPKAFEEAAFSMDTGQISGIVETEYGYHILRCVSTFDLEETDANKQRIVRQRKKEAFNLVYDTFVEGLHSNLNESLWDSVTYEEIPKTLPPDFFRIYDEIFTGNDR